MALMFFTIFAVTVFAITVFAITLKSPILCYSLFS